MKRSVPSVLLTVFSVFLSVFLFSGCASVRTASDVGVYRQKAMGGDESAVRALIGALRSSDRRVRDAAYKALIEVGPPAVPALIGTLNDDDPAIREYAAATLGGIGDMRAVKPLTAMLDGSRRRRYIAAWALGELKAAGATGLLVKSLGDKNDAVQRESARALMKIGPPAVPALITALDDPNPDVREYAARALGVIEDKRAEEPLVKALGDKNPGVAASAALALGTTGTEKCIGPLIAALGSGDRTMKVNVCVSLGQYQGKAKDAVGPLTGMLKSDDDPYLRQWAARALENITGRRYKYKDENGAMVWPYNLYR